MQAGKEERQQQARLGLREHLLEGQAPLTPEELEAADKDRAHRARSGRG